MTRAIMEELEAQLADEQDYQNYGHLQATDEQVREWLGWWEFFKGDYSREARL